MSFHLTEPWPSQEVRLNHWKVKAWSDQENNVLVAAYLRKHADLLLERWGTSHGGFETVMSVGGVAEMLDEMAYEIEKHAHHQKGPEAASAYHAYDLLTNCFGKELDDI